MDNTVTNLQNTVENKQDKLTFDQTPTEGSSNPVTSGGVYTAINDGATLGSVAIKIMGGGDSKNCEFVWPFSINTYVSTTNGYGEYYYYRYLTTSTTKGLYYDKNKSQIVEIRTIQYSWNVSTNRLFGMGILSGNTNLLKSMLAGKYYKMYNSQIHLCLGLYKITDKSPSMQAQVIIYLDQNSNATSIDKWYSYDRYPLSISGMKCIHPLDSGESGYVKIDEGQVLYQLGTESGSQANPTILFADAPAESIPSSYTQILSL